MSEEGFQIKEGERIPMLQIKNICKEYWGPVAPERLRF